MRAINIYFSFLSRIVSFGASSKHPQLLLGRMFLRNNMKFTCSRKSQIQMYVASSSPLFSSSFSSSASVMTCRWHDDLSGFS